MSRPPKTEKGAAGLLEQWAALDAQLAAIEAERNAAIGAANLVADAAAAPLLKQRDALQHRLEPWWREAGQALCAKGRKSIELAGCLVGSRQDRDVLGIEGDEAAIAGELEELEWAQPLLRRTVRLDKAAVLMSLDGVYAKVLAGLGLRRIKGADAFFIRRVAQGGTIAGAR